MEAGLFLKGLPKSRLKAGVLEVLEEVFLEEITGQERLQVEVEVRICLLQKHQQPV
jgi:hypothetical protein